MVEPDTADRWFRVAVLIPCYNEEHAVAKVVHDFQEALPDAAVYVYDNASEDRTSEVARAAGAIVRSELQRGKGNVVRRMFADVDADIYVLVDGDDTYNAFKAPQLIECLLKNSLDLVNASRSHKAKEAYRPGHQFGNRLLSGAVGWLFGQRLDDMLSGYKVFSRRFVKSFPALAVGFEIETELTVHALEQRMPLTEVVTDYKERPVGSTSKLNTVRDGLRIGWTVMKLLRDERPLPFFAVIFAVLSCTSVGLAVPVFIDFIETGLVPRFPTAILSGMIMLLGFFSLACGFILDTVTRGRRELKRIHYLSLPDPVSASIRTRPER
ncbi:MAG: glycosyltransferase family 2 protein [Pseudomonadota bacterium]